MTGLTRTLGKVVRISIGMVARNETIVLLNGAGSNPSHAERLSVNTTSRHQSSSAKTLRDWRHCWAESRFYLPSTLFIRWGFIVVECNRNRRWIVLATTTGSHRAVYLRWGKMQGKISIRDRTLKLYVRKTNWAQIVYISLQNCVFTVDFRIGWRWTYTR